MKIITAPEKYEYSPDDIKVFLAGGITNCVNWQQKVIDGISDRDLYRRIALFNPRRENFPINDKTAAYDQIKWEFNAIEKCDIFSMYFAAGESDQPICMYELGRNILRMQMRFPTDWQDRIIITIEEGYKRKNDVVIQTRLATNDEMISGSYPITDKCVEAHINRILDACDCIQFNASE